MITNSNTLYLFQDQGLSHCRSHRGALGAGAAYRSLNSYWK